MKGMEIKLYSKLSKFKKAVQSKACISEKNTQPTLPYSNFGSKCVGIYFLSAK